MSGKIPTPAPAGALTVASAAHLIAALKDPATPSIYVKAGAYGVVSLRSILRATTLQIVCEPGAHFERLTFASCAGMDWDGLSAWPDKEAPVPNNGVIDGDAATRGITIRNADVRSAADAIDYYSWSLSKWVARKTRGITLDGADCRVLDNRLTGLRIGAMVGGDRSLAKGNVIRGFTEDAMRVVGNSDGAAATDNDIADAVEIDKTHRDGIQAWSVLGKGGAGSGALKNLTVSRNRVREWIGPANHPLRGLLTGINGHDGTYIGLTLEDNELHCSAVTGYHWARVQGARINRNRAYAILRTARDRPKIIIQGKGIQADGNVAMKQVYPAGSTLSNNSAPNYASLPPMSLA